MEGLATLNLHEQITFITANDLGKELKTLSEKQKQELKTLIKDIKEKCKLKKSKNV